SQASLVRVCEATYASKSALSIGNLPPPRRWVTSGAAASKFPGHSRTVQSTHFSRVHVHVLSALGWLRVLLVPKPVPTACRQKSTHLPWRSSYSADPPGDLRACSRWQRP